MSTIGKIKNYFEAFFFSEIMIVVYFVAVIVLIFIGQSNTEKKTLEKQYNKTHSDYLESSSQLLLFKRIAKKR